MGLIWFYGLSSLIFKCLEVCHSLLSLVCCKMNMCRVLCHWTTKNRVSNLSDISAIEHWLNDDSGAMIA
jgi:hypothetical protein